MSNSGQREWRFYVSDMLEFAEKVLLYTDGLDQEKFVSSGLNYDATVRNLSMIGEAATRTPEHVRHFANLINWRQIIGTRNRLINGYLGLDNDIIWDIIQNEIPELIVQLTALIQAANDNKIR
ncbi:MAG: DUF86 domain-containing protein [Gallionellaceae bacterium]